MISGFPSKGHCVLALAPLQQYVLDALEIEQFRELVIGFIPSENAICNRRVKRVSPTITLLIRTVTLTVVTELLLQV